ncbi:DUF4913 domain-containing protein [Nocardia jejuensis]|uniref:DUF4913 domain-containing protein n=1 Tax=Nocardia jejuensis TaxID=328049 RepID=UPI00082F9912|nr:DUF4913 domain-containing protein [Nocardia jejuensis]
MSTDGFDDIDDTFAGTTPTAPPPEGDGAIDYLYSSVYEFVTEWLALATSLKLSDFGRGRVFCRRWFEHPPVVVRLDALWRAWEKARRSGDDKAMHGWWVYDYDATMREITNGEVGPMRLCSPTKHRDTPSLEVDPVPADYIAVVAKPNSLLHVLTPPIDPRSN